MNSIKPFSIAVALIILISCSFTSNKHVQANEQAPVFQIDFQEYFNQDTLSLKINNCSIFTHKELTSNFGVTKAVITGFNVGNKSTVTCFNETVSCGSINTKLNIEITLNGKISSFLVDIKKGKYIGFSKNNKQELILTQSTKIFQYD